MDSYLITVCNVLYIIVSAKSCRIGEALGNALNINKKNSNLYKNISGRKIKKKYFIYLIPNLHIRFSNTSGNRRLFETR